MTARSAARDIACKIADAPAMQAILAGPLALIGHLLRQLREDRASAKLYSLHAPEVECIGRGKARARFEFGVKVLSAATNARAPGGQFVVGVRSLPGNPYDGHTLAAQIAQAERLTGQPVERVYVARGYRGHALAEPPRSARQPSSDAQHSRKSPTCRSGPRPGPARHLTHLIRGEHAVDAV